MKINHSQINEAFDDLISERKTRREIANWADSLIKKDDSGELEYKPSNSYLLFFDALQFLSSVDLENSPSNYLYTTEDFVAEQQKFISRFSQKINFPLIVCCNDGSEILIAHSEEEATTGMEGIDVRDGLYSVYDSEGYSLKLSVEYEQKKIFGFINLYKIENIIISHVGDLPKKNEVKGKMLSFLKATNRLPAGLNINSEISEFLDYKNQINS